METRKILVCKGTNRPSTSDFHMDRILKNFEFRILLSGWIEHANLRPHPNFQFVWLSHSWDRDTLLLGVGQAIFYNFYLKNFSFVDLLKPKSMFDSFFVVYKLIEQGLLYKTMPLLFVFNWFMWTTNFCIIKDYAFLLNFCMYISHCFSHF